MISGNGEHLWCSNELSKKFCRRGSQYPRPHLDETRRCPLRSSARSLARRSFEFGGFFLKRCKNLLAENAVSGVSFDGMQLYS